MDLYTIAGGVVLAVAIAFVFVRLSRPEATSRTRGDRRSPLPRQPIATRVRE